MRTQKTRWWKLNDAEYQERFVKKVEEELEQHGERNWNVVSTAMQAAAKEALGETSGKGGKKEETWWWNAEVQEAVAHKKKKKKERDLSRCEETIKNYKQANKEAKRAVAKAKGAAFEDLYESLEGKDGQQKAIRIAKQKNRESQDVYQVKLMKDGEGNVLADEDEIKERWRSYFEKLMNEENERIDRVIETGVETRVERVSEEEVKIALKGMKRGKAVGPDNIPVEAWRVLGRTGIECLTSILKEVMEKEEIPEEWRDSILVPVFKNKGDIQDCSNYRGIKLTSHSLKLWERIIEKRLREKVSISEQQFGFMPGRSTTDAIFALRQVMEKYREGQRDLHCVFLDLEKAYDRVPRTEVWNCLRIKKVDEKYIRLVQDMYRGSTTRVRCAAGITQQFEVTVGLHQGSALSPFLFAIIMDCLTENIQRQAPWDMLFADDVVICAETRQEVEERLEVWRRALEDRGMKVSRQKTEYMWMGGQGKIGEVEMQGEQIKRTEEFKYLGSTVQTNGGSEKEVEKRVQAGWSAWKKITGILCDRRVPAKVKGKLFKTMVRPAMLYGMEAVAVTQRQEATLEVAEMKMLRYSLGKTLLDHVRNEDIRSKVKVGQVRGKLRETRLRWLGHVVRRDEEYVGKRMRKLAVGARKRGRPRRRWKDCIKEDLKAIERTEEDAKDRVKWRTVIRTGDPT